MMLFLALPISASTQMQKMTVISASDVDSVLHGIRCGAVVDRWHHASLPDSFSRVLYAAVSIDSIILLHIKQPTIRTDFKWPVTYAHNHASLLRNQSETCKCYQHCALLQHIAMNLYFIASWNIICDIKALALLSMVWPRYWPQQTFCWKWCNMNYAYAWCSY